MFHAIRRLITSGPPAGKSAIRPVRRDVDVREGVAESGRRRMSIEEMMRTIPSNTCCRTANSSRASYRGGFRFRRVAARRYLIRVTAFPAGL